MMNPSDSRIQSPLDKPLTELTEEDIAQLTREDCRRFLKLKVYVGMRRPSWNKSQAIQQVISLKALLDDLPIKTTKEAVTSPPVLEPSKKRVAEEDPSPYRRKDPNPVNRLTCAARADEHWNHLPSVETAAAPEQMTIFYGGNVNVYSEVSVEKAHAIMHIAESPMDLDNLSPEPLHVNNLSNSTSTFGPVEWVSMQQNEDNPGGNAGCATGRQASLQRYREKRKDRYKGKGVAGGSSSNMEMMLLNQKFRDQIHIPNEQSNHNNTSYASQPRPPFTITRCSSVENHSQKVRIYIDLNDDGGGN